MFTPISLPNKIYFLKEEGNKSVVVIEPLYPGYGVTIGNALRRVLLSSLPGAAVTFVKIKGVDHEFSTIPNVTEDVVDVILNLKQLRLRLEGEEPVRLELRVKGDKGAKAKDIKADSRVEIINPDLKIATLDNKNAELVMEIVVEPGRGYVPVEMREQTKPEIGMIAMDAIFTPVRNVNFEVQNVRVGQITNYDKLTLAMETDATISGRQALDLAAQILVDHFSMLQSKKLEETKPVEEVELVPEQITESDLKSLGLSNRAYNALVRNNITSISALRALSQEELSNLEGLGAKSVEEILKILESHAS